MLYFSSKIYHLILDMMPVLPSFPSVSVTDKLRSKFISVMLALFAWTKCYLQMFIRKQIVEKKLSFNLLIVEE